MQNRNLLLILDNFEQVSEAASLIARLLERCPELKVLVTSRMGLRLRGEMEIPVPPLEVPDSTHQVRPDNLAHYTAMELYCQRARAIKPGFQVTEKTAPVIAEICRRLDGLPLAIELAAARTRLLTPKGMLSRLEARLPVLKGGPRDLPERQQTMHNTISWSYDLLESSAAHLFRRMAVFVGGCTLEAVETVCNGDSKLGPDVLDILESLTEKNLIRLREGPDGEPRFEMLETIREFALEKLHESGEQPALDNRHARYFVDLAERAEPHYRSGGRDRWLSTVEAELDNLRAVFHRSLSRQIDPEMGIRLVGNLGWFFHLRGHLAEGRNWASQMLALPEAAEPSELRARALFPAGGLAWSQSDYETSVRLLQESASLFREVGDKFWLVQAQVILAGAVASLEDYEKAYWLCKEALTLSREIRDRWSEAYTLYWLGDIHLLRTGDYTAVQALYEQSLSIYTELDDPWGQAEVRGHLGIVAAFQDDMDSAGTFFELSLAYMRQIGDRWALARGFSGFADAMLRLGDYEKAGDLFSESLSLWKALGNTPGLMVCLAGLARVAAAQEQYRRAARLFGTVRKPFRVVGILLVPEEQSDYKKQTLPTRSQLGEANWTAAFEEGRAMTPEEAIEFALQGAEGSFRNS